MKLKNLTPFLFFFLIITVKGYSQKIDTVYHINGNVLTGDLKKMTYGVFTWKMDGMGTISLEEVKVKTIKSPKQFEVKMKNGLIYFGSLDTSGVADRVYIKMTNGRELLLIDDIVEIYPIRRNFWLRTSGNFSLGFNYTKGSGLGTISFAGNLLYRKQKSSFTLDWDDYNTYQGDSLSSTKADASIGWQRLLKNKWSIGIGIGISQNSELGTRMRLDVAALGIRDIVYNNWNRFYLAGGLSVQRETPYDTSGITNDLTGIASVVWKVYKYTHPKVWVDTDVTFLPYLTNSGRYRTNINVNPKVSIVSDNLKIGFKFYYSHDSKPASTDASSNDWGISLEITYALH